MITSVAEVVVAVAVTASVAKASAMAFDLKLANDLSPLGGQLIEKTMPLAQWAFGVCKA